jgi:hypothetical protein
MVIRPSLNNGTYYDNVPFIDHVLIVGQFCTRI